MKRRIYGVITRIGTTDSYSTNEKNVQALVGCHGVLEVHTCRRNGSYAGPFTFDTPVILYEPKPKIHKDSYFYEVYIQPIPLENVIASVQEQLQEDILTIGDGLPEELLCGLCDTVVKAFSRLKKTMVNEDL